MTAPCKGCPNRVVGCHGSCVLYGEFRAYMDEVNKQKILEREYWDATMEAHKKQKRKNEIDMARGSIRHKW